jgi:hypothetical protein
MSKSQRYKLASFGLLALLSCGQPSPQKSLVHDNHAPAADGSKAAILARPRSGRLTMFVYRTPGTQYAEVFDIASRRMAVRSYDKVAPPNKASVAGEFSGPLISCDTVALRCFRSGISVAVPRHLPWPNMWGTAQFKCRQVPTTSAGDELSGICEYGNGFATLFVYSNLRGIVSFQRTCADCSRRELVLTSEKGLFSDIASEGESRLR